MRSTDGARSVTTGNAAGVPGPRSERGRIGDAAAAVLGPLLLLVFLTGGAAGLQEADLLARILAEDDATVRLEYRIRENVELCRGGGLRIDRGARTVHRSRWSNSEWCGPGPAVLHLRIRNGRPSRVDLEPRPPVDRRPERLRALGRVSAPAAAHAMLALARRAPGEAAEDALVAAVVADSATVWPELLELARNPEMPRGLRKAAVFWTGQLAAERATEGLREIVALDRDDLEVRTAAVFSLSQLPPDAAVPALRDVARTAPHPKLRRSAFFWLAQVDDPRVPAFFEEVLSADVPRR